MRIIGGFQTDDPAHWRNLFVDCPVVKLNGVVVKHVCEADDVVGYVVVECYGPGNKLLLDETGQKIKTKRCTGRVDFVGKHIR